MICTWRASGSAPGLLLGGRHEPHRQGVAGLGYTSTGQMRTVASSAVRQGRRARRDPPPETDALHDAAHVHLAQSGQLGPMSIAAMAEEQAAQQQQLAHVARAQQFLGQRQQGGGLQVGDGQHSTKLISSVRHALKPADFPEMSFICSFLSHQYSSKQTIHVYISSTREAKRNLEGAIYNGLEMSLRNPNHSSEGQGEAGLPNCTYAYIPGI